MAACVVGGGLAPGVAELCAAAGCTHAFVAGK